VAQLATNFPNSLDTLTNPNSSNPLSSPSHSQQHANENDAIEALQSKVGVNGSADTNSLDYKVSSIESQITSIGNSADAVSTLLGLEGNNDLVVSGIENKTIIDYFSKAGWRTVKYEIQISKTSGSLYYSSSILALNDGTDIQVSESNIVSNSNSSLATVTFEENNGIINLCVTPVSGSITVRYYRTALKA
jgi:hypothetical protein